MITFEDQYTDVLQNIEWALLVQTKSNPDLCDYDMLKITEQAIAYYKSVQKEHIWTQKVSYSAVEQQMFTQLLCICDWRLGKRSGPSHVSSCTPITIEELILCLKRIEKSIKFWTKQGGRKGYIHFVAPRALL